jgi:hypothetical protein
LAQILNTYVHCAYKHEPFLNSKQSSWLEIRKHLDRESPDALRRRYEKVSRSAVHGIDQPPFPAKSVRHQDPKVMHALYALGNRVPALRRVYETYARPHMHEDADVLIKDVNFPNELLPRLCEVLSPWLIPIVRNPFANIASHLKGVERGYFAEIDAKDKARVRELIDAHGHASLMTYRDRLDDLSLLQFETVRWRLQVEPLIAFARKYEPSMLVVYEDLCADPMGKTRELFDFLGWRMHQTTRDFLEASTSGDRKERSSEHAYYTVFRDPRQSMNKWRTQLDEAQQREIASVFRDSPYTGLWNDLP